MKLPRFGVEEWLNTYETQAIYDIAGVSISALNLKELFDLTGDSLEEFLADFSKIRLDYGWIEGSPKFKEAVADLYQTVSSEQVLQTNGATGANLLALYALINPGDHVISLYPTYQQLYDIPKSLGATVDFWQVKEELGWLPDISDLEKLISPKTKMICLNNANNPFGAVMSEAFLKDVVKLAEAVGAYILVDEVYRSFDEQVEIPAIVDLYDKGISVNSLSKSFSLPGIRVGWVAAHADLIDCLRDYRDYTMISAGVFDDYLATYALENKTFILKRNQKLLDTNFALLSEWLYREPLAEAILPPKVSTSFVRLQVTQDIETFCKELLEETGVLLVPGNRFDREGFVRLGYCTETVILEEGLRRLSQFLHRNE
ncbi:aminotransferase [Streptococcus pluranimalium]